MSNFNPKQPTKYSGPNKYLTFFVSRNRQPTSADYRQPETGGLYSVGTVWQVGKNPTTGSEGELWMLGKIVANVAYWALINGGTPNVDSIQVDSFTFPGTNPVVADSNGLTIVTANQIANASLSTAIKTNSLAVNTYTIEIQQAATSAASDSTKNGISHFNLLHFTIGADAFISSQVATTSQIGIATLASQTQTEYNTYGTDQVVQSQYIPAMFARPAPIGSTSPNTGAFTNLTAIVVDGVPAVFTQTSTSNNAANTAIRSRVGSTGTPIAGFGASIELSAHNDANSFQTAARFSGIWEDPTSGSEDSYLDISLQENSIQLTAAKLYPTRLELRTGSTFRLGAGGIDFLSGTGDPNGVASAAKGSFYSRVDGSSTTTRAYINTDGTTAWTPFITST